MEEKAKDDNLEEIGEIVSSALFMVAFAAGMAWVLGVFRVPLSYGERFGMTLITMYAMVFVISEGVEIALKRSRTYEEVGLQELLDHSMKSE